MSILLAIGLIILFSAIAYFVGFGIGMSRIKEQVRMFIANYEDLLANQVKDNDLHENDDTDK